MLRAATILASVTLGALPGAGRPALAEGLSATATVSGPMAAGGGDAPAGPKIEAPAAASPPGPAPADVGGVTASPEVHLSGYLHADAMLVDQASLDEVDPSTGQPLNGKRFLIRRAVLRTDLRYGFTSGAVEVEANTVRQPTLRLIVAEASARWPPGGDRGAPPLVMATMGQFVIPFGLETQQRPVDRIFLEPSNMTRALFPGYYDLGARVQGGWRFLRYQAAIMNGSPLGDAQYPALDPNGAKDLVGRLGVDIAPWDAVRIEAGVSALKGTGFHKGTPATKDQIIWRDANDDGVVDPGEIQVIAGSAATPSLNFDRQALGADLQISADIPGVGTLHAYGEAMFAVNLDRALVPADPIAAGRDLRERGFVAGVAQEIRDLLLVGVRYDHYNPDADTYDQQGAAYVPRDAGVSTLAFLAAVRWPPLARLALEYDHNSNTFGRDPTGAPARLASDQLTLRAQVGF